MNVAWVNFAADIGPGTTNLTAFRTMFDSIRVNGGNSMRLWLHTTGASTPEFNSNGFVVGPGNNAIADLRAILDLAWERHVGLVLCLWSFDMLLMSRGSTITDRAMLLLTDTSAITAYTDNALAPMVDAVRGHPGIIAWEVFNEAEGMSDEFGWGDVYHVPMATIQRFVNRVAGAIHRSDPAAQVTTGAWSFISQSDATPPGGAAGVIPPAQAIASEERARIENEFLARYGISESAEDILSRFEVAANSNYYSDNRLIAAGGDPLGTLDFYTVHYYDWAGTALSPFHHPSSTWQLTKPLVIAEFYLNDAFGVSYGDMFENLYSAGYAGALTWQWANGGTQVARTKVAMRDLVALHPADIVVSAKLFVDQPASGFELFQNYPNPFNPSTTIAFSIPRREYVSLVIFDILGRLVETVAEGVYEPGRYQVTWNAGPFASGIYVYRLQTAGAFLGRKLMVM